MTVYEKILDVMSNINYLKKDGFVETTRGKGYKAITDEKVLSSIRPFLVKARLIMLPVQMTQKRTDEQVRTNDGGMKTNRITDVDVTYRIINVDDPKDFVDVVSSGTGVDTQDKGIGKAMTYAKKYAILNSFLIPSGDDTDSISSEKYTNDLLNSKGDPADPQQEAPKAEKDQKAAPKEQNDAANTEEPEQQMQSDRQINIATCIKLAEKYGKAAIINENGYNGRPWDALSDKEVTMAKLWLVAVGQKKKAGAA